MEDWIQALHDHARAALRPIEGSLRVQGPNDSIEIVTDTWGVPHVFASSKHDALFAQGWLHASERMWQMETTIRIAQGRLSEIVSIAGLALDKFFRTIGIGRLAREWSRDADEVTRIAANPYWLGVNAASELPQAVEYQFLELDPMIPQTLEEAIEATDSIVGLMGFTLSANWPFELLRAELSKHLGAERARELTAFIGPESPIVVPSSASFPGLAQLLRDAAFDAGAVRGLGSNNWVVDGTKTESGKPLLCNDPHLLVQMPSIWMEMHLCAPDLDVAGLSIPGVPGIVIGHNENIAWGFTNTGADVEDLYLEKLNEDQTQYVYDGAWRDVTVIEEPIFIRGEKDPLVHLVRETHHGPLITGWISGGTTPTVHEDRITDHLALRWMLREKNPSLEATLGMNEAADCAQFREATRSWPTAGQNMVYADTQGNIGYQFTGAVPLRSKGSGAAPLPGWDSSYEWSGTIPFDELPHSFNPERGFIATANHRMVDLDYPHYLTNDWEMGHRIRRITALLTSKERLSIHDMRRIQSDTYSGVAADLVPLLLAAGVEHELIKHLREWDLTLSAGSIAACIFNVWISHLMKVILEPKLGRALYEDFYMRKAWTTNWCYDSLLQILRNPQQFWVGGDGSDNVAARNELIKSSWSSALDELRDRLGDDSSEWSWGRIHTVHFSHVLATAMPLLHDLFSSGPFEVGGGDDTINRGVFYPAEGFVDGALPSARLIMDLSNFDNSRSVITTGNSGNPASPHYRDQSTMWSKVEDHPMLFSRDAINAAAEGALTLLPV
ncbi:MAG: penicillin acylase family protein [Actinomycetota bacterium]